MSLRKYCKVEVTMEQLVSAPYLGISPIPVSSPHFHTTYPANLKKHPSVRVWGRRMSKSFPVVSETTRIAARRPRSWRTRHHSHRTLPSGDHKETSAGIYIPRLLTSTCSDCFNTNILLRLLTFQIILQITQFSLPLAISTRKT